MGRLALASLGSLAEAAERRLPSHEEASGSARAAEGARATAATAIADASARRDGDAHRSREAGAARVGGGTITLQWRSHICHYSYYIQGESQA